MHAWLDASDDEAPTCVEELEAILRNGQCLGLGQWAQVRSLDLTPAEDLLLGAAGCLAAAVVTTDIAEVQGLVAVALERVVRATSVAQVEKIVARRGFEFEKVHVCGKPRSAPGYGRLLSA